MDEPVFEPSNKPWSAEGSDPLADLKAAAEMIRAANIPPLPDIRAGSSEIFLRYLLGTNIEIWPARNSQPWELIGIGNLAGIPVQLDPTLPPNMIRINDVYLVEKDDGTWWKLEMSADQFRPVPPKIRW